MDIKPNTLYEFESDVKADEEVADIWQRCEQLQEDRSD